MHTATFEIEQACRAEYPIIIGVDEAGRGPLAGPVVAAAALYRGEDFEIPGEFEASFALIRDSKTLSSKQREKIFDFIHEHFFIGIGLADPATIDRVNILQATFVAMKKAIGNLRLTTDNLQHKEKNFLILVDGNREIPNFSLKQQTVVDGDRLSKSIAAASIVAKVTRDRMMEILDKQYPQYGFARHKGYGTREHLLVLEKYGPTSHHRMSFNPVHQAVLKFREWGIDLPKRETDDRVGI